MAQTRKSGSPAGPIGRLRAGLLMRLRSTRGFILIIVVGMLAVLVVLGISFAEQGRVDLMGASNSRDIAATDALAESGFEMAKRILIDDRHVWSSSNPAWDTSQGPGWTSRWPYNPYYDQPVSSGGTQTPSGGAPNTNGPAPSRDDPSNFLDAWALMTWNEEDKGSNAPYAYLFKFDPADARTWFPQRLPHDEKMLMDTFQRQPLARTRKFRVNNGTAFGIIQISITPKDGAINLNDVFQPGTGEEYPGWYETLPVAANTSAPPSGVALAVNAKVHRASPDRRTMEYILGKRCEWATRQPEDAKDPQISRSYYAPYSLFPSGHANIDNGVYCFPSYSPPYGRDMGYNAHWNQARLTGIGTNPLTPFYNSDDRYPNRYNQEAPRYPIWAPQMGMSLRVAVGGIPGLPNGYMSSNYLDYRRWYEGGRYGADPKVYGQQTASNFGKREFLFSGFGFDLMNPKRGGLINAAGDDPHIWFGNKNSYDDQWGSAHIGAGAYGHPRPHSFQFHFLPAVQQGRFWTDLEANYYFGGAPGYSSLGYLNYSWIYNCWSPISSGYDTLGMGSNWMTPTMHLWRVGAWNSGNIHNEEIKRGYTREPGTMPAAKPIATYTYPQTRFADDLQLGNVHFLYNDARTSLRAFGLQENWGLYGQDDPDGRYYDAVCVNITNFQVVYGLLTPEKLPSMLERTVVAPHLHWKSRLLDGAYMGLDTFARYGPANPAWPPRPYWVRDALPTDPAPVIPPAVPGPPTPAVVPYGYGAIDTTALPGAINVKVFHPYPKSSYVAPLVWPAAVPVVGAEAITPGPSPANDYPLFDDTGAANTWAYSKYVGPTYFKYSIHRAYLDRSNLTPLANPASVAEAQRAVLGKMDFVTAEPAQYLDQDGATELRKGTGKPMDDVFTDTWYDLLLAPPFESGDALNSSCSPRPDQIWNWTDWFMQRLTLIHVQHNVDGTVFKPGNGSNVVVDTVAVSSHVEGVDGDRLAPVTGTAGIRKYNTTVAANYAPRPHPLYGLPNPNYLQLFPGSSTSIHWSDQFHRYFPLVTAYPKNTEPNYNIPAGQDTLAPKVPTAPWEGSKVVDWFDGNLAKTHGMPGVDRMIHPEAPVAKVYEYNSIDPFVPAVSKDDAWRITRIGPKYQDILANEIMDYQMNPWWPNPCVHQGTVVNPQLAVPLDRTPYLSATRQYGAVADLRGAWWSRQENAGKAGIAHEIPDYFAYWNRFWVRSATKYDRTVATGTPVAYNDLTNPTENHGTYPQALQYFGQPITIDVVPNRWRDRVLDFPFNTLEDATGGDWRYVSGCANLMYEVNVASTMRNAPARNHPFRNWADFVGFLGHLVYRSPIDMGGPKDYRKGVHAWTVCHGAPADARNTGNFFDGSRISNGAGGAALADALKGSDVVGYGKCIVARDGWWPISGNYGEYPTAGGPKDYPDAPGVWSTDIPEWQRRVDEWRGRDAAGLRIEQNYISERAANDVLVSLSNGRIGPIDFDGDGKVTMTSKRELPLILGYGGSASTAYSAWPGFPWNDLSGNDAKVQRENRPGIDYNNVTTATNFGLKDGASTWSAAPKNEIIQGCVTLPIKFRANTFRVTIVVELTDAQYKNVYASRRYARWYSRIPGEPVGGVKVHGPYTGELFQHGTRTMGTVDPEMDFLSTTRP